MASLFPPWSNTALRLGIALLAASVLSAILSFIIFVRTPWRRREFESVAQPVEFDHRHHTQDDGIDCRYCHSTVDKAATAGIPTTEKCMGCHSQIWNQSPMLEPVRRSYFSRMPIPWSRVHDLPDFVYFDHSIHVNRGVGCVTCHGRVDRMASVYQVAPLTMDWCLDCHRAPETRLRPIEQVTNMRWNEEKTTSLAVARRFDVARLTHCSTCHR
jgi:Cytochrome c7 and related cytochrome c